MPSRLVIFDCDGVLIDSERLINRTEAGLFSRLGLALSPNEARALFKGHTVGEVVTIAESALGDALPIDWIYEWGTHVALAFVNHLTPVVGVQSVLDHLQSQAIPMCVASQSPRVRCDLGLAVTGLDRYFQDRVYTAAMVPRPKPHPDLFLYAAARMDVTPDRCVVVEDSASGVRAAVAAGMRAFGYAADDDAHELQDAGATTFTAMHDLPSLLGDALGDVTDDSQPTPSSAVARVQTAYEAFAAGHPRLLSELLAEDAVYHLPGRHLGGGTLRGRRALFERLTEALATLDFPPTIHVERVVGHGEWVLSTERFVARRNGRTLADDVCVVWRMAGERCAEMRARFSDQRACDRFWRTP